MFRESITKEELAELPLIQFEGEITVVDEYSQINKIADFLAKQQLIGFDTETRPSFKKGVVYKVALLQLSTNGHAFLFRLNKIGLPGRIVKILQSKDIIKMGVALRDDIKALQSLADFKPNKFIDLQESVKDFGIKNFSLKKLTAIILGFRISKSQQLSNWETESLTEAQQIYAATDAWVALRIYENLFVDRLQEIKQ